jgi:hypothetical protein
MPNRTKAAKARLLADRQPRINDQREISLAQAQDVFRHLDEITYFLDELASASETRHDPAAPAVAAADNSELHPISPNRVRWE